MQRVIWWGVWKCRGRFGGLFAGFAVFAVAHAFYAVLPVHQPGCMGPILSRQIRGVKC
jgi:hypothetical protein